MRARRILLVDDSSDFVKIVRNSLGRAFSITEATSEQVFRQTYRPRVFDLVILDLRLESGREGLHLLREIIAMDELQPVIMVSAFGDTDAVLDSAEAGALMFLHKQEFTPDLMARMVEAVLQQAQVRRHLAALKNRLPSGDPLALMGGNPVIRLVLELIRRAAEESDSLVVVGGETGTGHEIVAAMIHERSRHRSVGPMLSVPGLPRSLPEWRELLFGSSAQGGSPRRRGVLEQAHGGVAYLGGLDALDPAGRLALSQALRGKTLLPAELGIPLDIQFIAGSRPEAAGGLADALRLAQAADRIIEIFLPPLRERKEDLPLLAAGYLHELRQQGQTTARSLAPAVLGLLEAYPWPGNLFELKTTVEFAGIQALNEGSEELAARHLPQNLNPAQAATHAGRWDYRFHMAHAELALVARAIKEGPFSNKGQLAERLGYSDRFAFGRRMRKTLAEFPELKPKFPEVAGMFAGHNRGADTEEPSP